MDIADLGDEHRGQHPANTINGLDRFVAIPQLVVGGDGPVDQPVQGGDLPVERMEQVSDGKLRGLSVLSRRPSDTYHVLDRPRPSDQEHTAEDDDYD